MRHPLHSICPYFAMFPEDFVAKQVLAYTRRGDTVLDPFCGRGTTVFESLLQGRNAIGVDVNPVAACVAGAKADAPMLKSVEDRLNVLESAVDNYSSETPSGEFFRACFHETTLRQILYLRSTLDWKTSRTDRFIAAVTLGVLHGESHKSPNCLSNRMPRTISTKPDYSVQWWKSRNLIAPQRNAFAVIRNITRYRLAAERPQLRGEVRLQDARKACSAFRGRVGTVALIVTSPPYLDTTNYYEDQWLRLWFLGGAERPVLGRNRDDRHSNPSNYWRFLEEAWRGCAKLMMEGANVVVRIGGTRLTKQELFEGVKTSLKNGFSDFRLKTLHAGITSEITNRQTNVFRPGTTSRRYEQDFAFRLG